MSTFATEFARLNREQKHAVETVEGPVMVIAGPGTGKTQVLAMRVANILKKTQAKPSNILCLTFSTSGSTAMRDRLRSLIGSDAYGVTVSTIHGFTNDIIQSNPLVFDDWSALEQISDIERYRQVNKIIDALMPKCVLVSKKHPYTRTRDILARISDVKREGRADENVLRKVVEDYHEQMEAKSKAGTKAHEQHVLKAKKFADFVEVFIRYQDMLQHSGRYDYDDMILHVIAALRENDWLLSGLQERYQYILVDEFQDTNGAQYDFIDLLTTPRTPEDKPNLFIVGDDDQAIYRFQGANLTNILRFHQRFPLAPIIVLTTSYRCSQPILDAAGSLIRKNTDRLLTKIEGLTKDLSSSRKSAEPNPELFFSPSDVTEPWLIADLIEERMASGTQPEQIAILVQKNAELRPISEVLRARSLPVQMTGSMDLLVHPLIVQALAIFRSSMNPKDNGALASAMSCACFGCHPADLGRIFLERERGKSLLELLLSFGIPNAEKDPVALHEKTSILRARDTILDLHSKMKNRTIVETFERLLKDSGILPLVTDHPLDPLDFAALQAFFDRIKYRAYEQPNFDAEAFDDDLEHYMNPDYADLRMTYDLPHLTDKGVALMTAHRSKGLEFDTVILPNFRERHWDHRRNPGTLSLPEDLLFGWSGKQKKYESEQDERRIAFVAMTRARNELIFTCPRQLTQGVRSRDSSPSVFFAEAGTLIASERELRDPEHAATLMFSPVRHLDEEYKTFLRRRIENFSLSVTALNHFLEDPVIFETSDLLQMPQSKDSSLVYGNAVHEALRDWGLKTQAGQPVTETAFLSSFRRYIEEREVLTTAEMERLTKHGEESLPRYFAQRLEGFKPFIAHVELPISAHLGDIPIKGKIDRLDLAHPNSSVVRIIDYKTGAPKTESQIRDDEDYFRQLVFYSLLLKHGKPFYTPDTFILDFIGEGTDHPVERTFQITQEDERHLTKVIEAVWAKVQALDFTPIDRKSVS